MEKPNSSFYFQKPEDSSVTSNGNDNPHIYFDSIIDELNKNSQIQKLFSSVFKGKSIINFGEFMLFLKDVQISEYSTEEGEMYFLRYSHGKHLMTKHMFIEYLFSPHNNILSTKSKFRELKMPLNHYYVKTSHNTYLTSYQFGHNTTSLEGYVSVLKKGCRCIEIDCYNGFNGIPIVCHKKVFTSSILFSDVIYTIKKYAFVFTPYPLILSLEIHCDLAQRKKMVEVFTSILGDSLAFESNFNSKSLPSPESLKHKIILRGRLSRCVSRKVSSTKKNSILSNDVPECTSSPLLQDLITFMQICSLKNLEKMDNWKCNMSFSISENVSNMFIKKHSSKYLQLNKLFMVRVYPSFMRIFSSNFNPLPHWVSGCSMVALNYQTKDSMLELNSALFEVNNGCGYVPKSYITLPRYTVQSVGAHFNSNKLTNANFPNTISLSIAPICTLIPEINKNNRKTMLYVEVKVIQTNRSFVKSTEFAKYRSPLYYWDDKLCFNIKYYDPCFTRFKILCKHGRSMKKLKLASSTVCIDFVRQGYKNIVLENSNNEFRKTSFISLLVNIEIR